MSIPPWAERPVEHARLLNPAFLGALLWSCANGYASSSDDVQPYLLSFLVPPIILHKATRETLPTSTRTSLAAWLGERTEVHVGFAERATALVPLVKEALIFAANGTLLRLERARVHASSRPRAITRFEREASDEVKDCLRKAAFVGKWFAVSGSYTTVMALWGVSP